MCIKKTHACLGSDKNVIRQAGRQAAGRQADRQASRPEAGKQASRQAGKQTGREQAGRHTRWWRLCNSLRIQELAKLRARGPLALRRD